MNQRVELITQSAYARLRGVAKSAVAKAVAEKRISLIDGMIDPTVADIQWEKNTRARAASGHSSGHVSTPSLGYSDRPGPDPEAPPQAPQAPLVPPPAVDPNGYTAARARREQAEAETAEIQLRKLRGELCSMQDVARGGFEAARELRDALESSVNSLASEMAGLSSADECAQVLRRHNRAIQELLAKSMREKLSLTVGVQ